MKFIYESLLLPQKPSKLYPMKPLQSFVKFPGYGVCSSTRQFSKLYVGVFRIRQNKLDGDIKAVFSLIDLYWILSQMVPNPIRLLNNNKLTFLDVVFGRLSIRPHPLLENVNDIIEITYKSNAFTLFMMILDKTPKVRRDFIPSVAWYCAM